MATKNKNASIRRHLVSTGMMFPANEDELQLFEKQVGPIDTTITGKEIDPRKIIADNKNFQYSEEELAEFGKCARPVLPAHIKEKLKNSAKKVSHASTLDDEVQIVSQRIWTHKSVRKMVEESGDTPINTMKDRARTAVLDALEKGWSGPPFSAISLAKILGLDILPNDEIMDARTVPVSKGRYLIEYNPHQKPTRMNFSIAHEIAHTLFSDCGEMVRNREEHPDENRELEELCNIGASELQLPYVVFPHAANALEEISVKSLIKLAGEYKTSLESTFLGFVSVVDKPCAMMICAFQTPKKLTIEYYKASSTFEPRIPKNFKIPEDSRAYYCTSPGETQTETVKWSFLEQKYDITCVGLSPTRKDTRGRVGIIIKPNDGSGDLHLRKVNYEFGDATKPHGKGNKIIAQVVNTSGSLARGFGKALWKNYPVVKKALDDWKSDSKKFKMGQTQLIQVKHDTYVLQMLAQKGLFTKDGEIPLKYTCLKEGLVDLRHASHSLNAEVFMPKIGAGNAKGDWAIIEGMIYSELVNHDIKVNILMLSDPKTSVYKSSLSMFNESSSWRKEK